MNRFFEGDAQGRLLGLRSPPVGMPGCHATVFQGHLISTATRESTFAPSYHFVTDLGTDEAWTNLPGGPSESRLSKWYNVDIPRLACGRSTNASLQKLSSREAWLITGGNRLMAVVETNLMSARAELLPPTLPNALESAGERARRDARRSLPRCLRRRHQSPQLESAGKTRRRSEAIPQ